MGACVFGCFPVPWPPALCPLSGTKATLDVQRSNFKVKDESRVQNLKLELLPNSAGPSSVERIAARVAAGAKSLTSFEQSDVLYAVLVFGDVADLLQVWCVSCACCASCEEPRLWKALGEFHLRGSSFNRPESRMHFVKIVILLNQLLETEAADRSPPRISELLQFARCELPIPSTLGKDKVGDGAALLAARGTQARLASLVRMDDETSWIAHLPDQDQGKVYLHAMQLLALLCERSSVARVQLQKETYLSNGYMDLPEVLQEHAVRELKLLHWLQVDSDMRAFPSIDCEQLRFEGVEAKLRSVADLFYHLFADEADRSNTFCSTADRSPEQLSADLSGSWCTAMTLGKRRIDGIPGDFHLRFNSTGTLEGSGCDAYGDFTLSGTWLAGSPRIAVMRKQCDTPQRRYAVDLLAFIYPSEDNDKVARALTLRGIWYFHGQASGFWAWQGSGRELRLPVAMHSSPPLQTPY